MFLIKKIDFSLTTSRSVPLRETLLRHYTFKVFCTPTQGSVPSRETPPEHLKYFVSFQSSVSHRGHCRYSGLSITFTKTTF